MKKSKNPKKTILPACYKDLLSNLLSIINHDFRSPAASIKNAVEILEKDSANEPETKKEFLCIISDENNYLIELIKDIITTTKIDLGLQEWDFEIIKIGNLTNAINENCPRIMQKKKQVIKIENKTDPEAQIKIDFNRILQVFEILISNASKFSGHGKEILITFIKNKKNLEIKIIDQGIGISKDIKSSIFKKLNPHNYPPDKPKGTGVGLYLAKKIIEANKGKISFESVKNKGTTFIITLPTTPLL